MQVYISVEPMITKDLVQKMIASMRLQSKSSNSSIYPQTLTVLEQLYRELNFRPSSWATSLAHTTKKNDLIAKLVKLLGYQAVLSFCD